MSRGAYFDDAQFKWGLVATHAQWYKEAVAFRLELLDELLDPRHLATMDATAAALDADDAIARDSRAVQTLRDLTRRMQLYGAAEDAAERARLYASPRAGALQATTDAAWVERLVQLLADTARTTPATSAEANTYELAFNSATLNLGVNDVLYELRDKVLTLLSQPDFNSTRPAGLVRQLFHNHFRRAPIFDSGRLFFV